MSNTKNRIKSFDSFRFIFCISIFLNHCTFFQNSEAGYSVFERFMHNGRYGVTFFFILSAFCIYKSHENIYIDSFKSYKTFICKRIIKFYPLYMLMNLVALIFELIRGASPLKVILAKFFLSATMLQTLTIKYWAVGNSAGWYISALFVLYLLSPFFIYLVRKIKKVFNWIIVLLALLSIVEFGILRLVDIGVISQNLADLINYIFPIYWIPAYVLGMLLAKVKPFEENTTSLEIVSIMTCIVAYYLGINGPIWICKYKHVLYVTSVLLLIYVFSLEKGKISKFIVNLRILQKGGEYSMEIYLIHFVVINCGGYYILKNLDSSILGDIVITVILFIITLILSFLYKKGKLLYERKRS